MKKKRINKNEIIADYFHRKKVLPDIDGYIGTYVLPKPIMKIYTKKYGKRRKWF